MIEDDLRELNPHIPEWLLGDEQIPDFMLYERLLRAFDSGEIVWHPENAGKSPSGPDQIIDTNKVQPKHILFALAWFIWGLILISSAFEHWSGQALEITVYKTISIIWGIVTTFMVGAFAGTNIN